MPLESLLPSPNSVQVVPDSVGGKGVWIHQGSVLNHGSIPVRTTAEFVSSAPQTVQGPWRGNSSYPDSRLKPKHEGIARVRALTEQGKVKEAVEALELLLQQGWHITESVFYCVLQACVLKKDLVLGSRVHAQVVRSGYQDRPFLANHIIGMYASHKRLGEAVSVFSGVASPNVHMWSSIILAHARHGQPTRAIRFYRQMRESSVKPDDHVYVAVLKACASAQDLVAGREVHSDIMGVTLGLSAFVGSSLVNMYAKCGNLEDAREVFERLPTKSVVSWTAMIAGYAHHGQAQEALDLYAEMQKDGMTPANQATFVCLLQACGSLGALLHGKELHAQIQKHGLEVNLVVSNCLLDMYCKCASLEDARGLFDRISTRDVVTWTTMLAGYIQHGLAQDALDLYSSMQQETKILPDCVTYLCLLQACATVRALDQGKQLHAEIQDRGLEADASLGISLVDMYAKCGSLDDALMVFDRLPTKDVVTWNVLIAGYVHRGLAQQALALYASMQQEGIVSASQATFVCLLQACARAGAEQHGKKLHEQIEKQGLHCDVILGNCLIDMYVNFSNLEDARKVFDRLPIRDVVTWTTMMAGYVQEGRDHEALGLYSNMQREGLTAANHVTFSCLLQACVSLGELDQGKHLHAEISERGLEANLSLGSSLVDMYAKCGSLDDARRVFDRLPTRDVVTWTAMVAGYAQHGLGKEALEVFKCMQEAMVAPTCVTYVCLLQACGSVGALDDGKQLHAQIEERGLEVDVQLGNCLLDMYVKCGSLEDARRVFDRLHTRDVVTWTAIISGYAREGMSEEAFYVYSLMQQDGSAQANPITLVCLLQACASVGWLDEGRQLHADVCERGLEADASIGSSLVSMYAKSGSVEVARTLFDRLPTRDVVTWNAMIAGYTQQGLGLTALALYASMQEEVHCLADSVTYMCLLQACAKIGSLQQGKEIHAEMHQRGLEADAIIGNCLVDMYLKCGSLEDARRVFDRLLTTNEETWTAMIAEYAQQGMGQDAFCLFANMPQVGNSRAAYVNLLNACTALGALQKGKEIHSQIQLKGLEADLVIGNCLVDMYSKCGSLADAFRVFDRLHVRDVVTWTSLLNGYGRHGDGQSAVWCFDEMQRQGFEPNETTYVSLLLACSHAGLVPEGRRYFRMMVEDCGIVPTDYHYSCMIDLLGRSGYLDEAEEILGSVPLQDPLVGWTSLLTSCKSHNDAERGRRCFDRLVRLEPENASAYVLMGNIYADAGSWKDVDRIETKRKAACAWKKPAKACIVVENKTHEFTVGEERDLFSKLRSVTTRLKEEGGHVPQTSLVLRDVSNQEKEDALCGHAEKLALAYGLLNTPDGTSLLVTKNLRMCNDCHSSTKIMSNLEKRHIIVRDSNRTHHFVDGCCSCDDRH